MINRQNVSALINEVQGNLNTYLGSHVHYLLNYHKASAGKDIINDGRKEHHNYHFIHYKDDKYITFFEALSDRNTELTLNRMKNIYTIRDTLDDLLKSLNEKQDEKSFMQLINQIRDLLIKGQEENTRLSNQYGYVHRSYNQNRALGLGMFSSLLHKTLNQSRANLSLEKALSALDQFVKKFNLQQDAGKNEVNNERPPAYTLSTSSAPSAPSASMNI